MPFTRRVSEAGAVARGDAPAVLAVAGELERVAARVLLLDVGRLAAVLEVVDVVLAHERVLDAAEVDPEVRELVREQRPGVEELAAVDLLPLVGRAVGGVALGRQRETSASRGRAGRAAAPRRSRSRGAG